MFDGLPIEKVGYYLHTECWMPNLLASRIADNIAGNRFWWRHQHPPFGATTAAHCQIERGEVAQQKKEFCGLVKLLTC